MKSQVGSPSLRHLLQLSFSRTGRGQGCGIISSKAQDCWRDRRRRKAPESWAREHPLEQGAPELWVCAPQPSLPSHPPAQGPPTPTHGSLPPALSSSFTISPQWSTSSLESTRQLLNMLKALPLEEKAVSPWATPSPAWILLQGQTL